MSRKNSRLMILSAATARRLAEARAKALGPAAAQRAGQFARALVAFSGIYPNAAANRAVSTIAQREVMA